MEIIGAKFEQSVWSPLSEQYDYHGIRTGYRTYQFPRAIPSLLDSISGDIVYASKPRTTSYGIGLLATLGRDRPLILDIDDWESGLKHANENRIWNYVRNIPRLININSLLYNRSLEALSGVADARTVSNRFLQERFGGTLVPHARDTEKFDPTRFDQKNARKELGLPTDAFLVMFSGTPRPHKGVDDLAQAVSEIGQQNVQAVVVGALDSEYVDKIKRIGGESVIIRGRQPFDDLPKWLAAADMVAIPQRDVPATRGQVPAKVFDAMAMAKPIVATHVSDLPEILEDCGLIIPPDSAADLRTAIEGLATDEQRQVRLGHRARQRCIAKYSYDAVAPRLANLIESVR